MSIYLRADSAHWWYVPLDRQEALEWAERYLTTEQVERGFGDVIEEA